MKRPADSAFDEQIALPSPPADSPISELDPPVAGSSRKRARSELTAEERKEARAHRNRIAAQNSRDRRKAQFQYLEQRVAQLEEENKQLRAGLGLAELSRSDEQTSEQREREKAREKENEELRARIKTLENGWDAVVKALTASGLPLNLPGPPPSSSESSSNHPSNPPPTGGDHRCPSFIFGDPAAGGSSNTNQLQLELTPSSTPSTTTSATPSFDATSNVDEVTMENLLREILAPSPTMPSSSLPIDSLAKAESETKSTTSTTMVPPVIIPAETVDWEGEAEMQRLLDMLPAVPQDASMNIDVDVNAVDFPSALDLELCGWDLGALLPQQPPSSVSLVGAF
ncbi:hypothetical protein C8Q75DRAFT_734604 [Abortiporus biennis]|nr:hypothetical protein C8Q75DRAFT_734604 [Abortiporus biennis]